METTIIKKDVFVTEEFENGKLQRNAYTFMSRTMMQVL